MSPNAGNYNICSRALSSSGEKLALTFNGSDKPITVTPLDPSSNKQRWAVQDHGSGTQAIVPKDNERLQAGWGKTIFTLPAGNYVWRIESDNGYVIKDGDRTIAWTIDSASSGTNVTPEKDAGGEKQRWLFAPA